MNKIHKTGIVITGDPKGGVRAVSLTREELEKLNTSTGRAEKKSKEFRKETKESGRSLQEYHGKLGLVTAGVGLLAGALAGISLTGIATETLTAARESQRYADALDVNIQSLTAFQYATKGVFDDQAKIGDIMKDTAEKIADAYANGAGEAVEALEALKLEAFDLVGLAADQQLLAIADSLDQVGTRAEKVQVLESLASDLSLMMPLLENDAAALRSMTDEAVSLGVALSDMDAAALEAVSREMDRMGGAFDGIYNKLVVAIAPALEDMAAGVTDIITTLASDEFDLAGKMETALTALVDIGEVLAVGGVVYAAVAGFPLILGAVTTAAGALVPVIQFGLVGSLYMLTSPIKTVTALFSSLIVKTNVLKAAMSFLTGPAGLAITGAAAFAAWKFSTDDAAESTANWSEKLATLRGDMQALEVQSLTKDLRAAQQRLLEIDESLKGRVGFFDVLFGDSSRKDIEAERGAVIRYMREVESSLKAASSATNKHAKANQNASKVTRKLTEDQKALLDTLFPLEKQAKDYTNQLNDLFKISELQGWSSNKLAGAVHRLAGEYSELTGVVIESEKSAEKATEKAEGIAQIYEDTATSIRGSFRDAFRDMLDGQMTLADRMLDVFKNMLADMAAMAAARPIMVPMVTGMGSMLGVSEGAQASTLQQLGMSQQEAMLTVQDAEFSDASKMGEMVGAGMIGYLAGGMMAKAFDVANPGMTQNLTAIGSAIGMGVGGPVGAAVGGAIGGIVGSMFGGSWQVKASGINLDYSKGSGVTGSSFVNQEKRGGVFGSDSERTLTESLDVALTNRLTLGFREFEYRLTNQLERLNLGNLNGLNNFASSATLNTNGMSSEQVQAAVQNWANEVSVEMARAVLPGLDTFRRAGEEAGETLERLGESLELMYSLGRNLDITIASLTAGDNAATQFAIQIEYATADIIETAKQLANTRDMQTRIELEQQLADQMMDRYKLEQQMLGQLQQTITTISGDISALRGEIDNNLAAIAGTGPRNLTAIGADLAGILPGGTPSADKYTSLIQQLGSAESSSNSVLADIVANQSVAADLENQISDQLAEYSSAVEEGVNDILKKVRVDNVNSIQKQLEQFRIAANSHYVPQLTALENELDKLNGAIATQQDSYQSLLNVVETLQLEADGALTDYNAEMSDYLNLTNDQVDQLKSLREETIAYYNAMASLDTAMQNAAAGLGDTLKKLRIDALSPVARLADYQAQFDALTTSAASSTGYDLISISEQLNQLVGPLLSEAEGMYASGAGYQDIYNNIVSTLGDLQQRLIDEAPQGYEESTVTLLTSIDSLLGDMQDVLSAAEQAIIDAIDLSRQHTVGTLEDIRELLGGEGRSLASYDVGTAYVPNDMTANIHRGEVIIDPQSSDILRRYGIQVKGGSDTETVSLLRRIEQLLREGGGDLHLNVVTEDGRTIREETIATYSKGLQRGEYTIPAKAVIS